MATSRYTGIAEQATASGTLSNTGQSIDLDVKRAVGVRVLCTAKVGTGGFYNLLASQDGTNWESVGDSPPVTETVSNYFPIQGYTFARLSLLSVPASGGIDGNASFFLTAPIAHTELIEGAGRVTATSGSSSSSGNTEIIIPSFAGAKLRVTYLSYNPLSPVEVAFRFGASGDLFLRNNIVTAGSIVAKDFGVRYIEGEYGESLFLNLSTGATTIWNVHYVEVF